MRAILHIGTEKTGTTSFQSFMHRNRKALREKGVLYPVNLGSENHRFIATYGLSMSTADESVRSLKIKSEQDMEAFYTMVESRLEKQIVEAKAAGVEVAVLSSEHLHSRLSSTDQIERVRNLLTRYFDEIEVYVHLRPQVDVLVSLASTRARVGSAVRRAFFDSAHNNLMYYNYDMLVAAWEEVFGANNLHCLAFNVTPDFLGFLAKRLNLDLTGFEAPQRLNEALDVRVIAMVNALVDSGSSQRIDFSILDQLPVEQHLQLDLVTAQKIQYRFQESNRTLISRRRDLQPGQLQPNWKRYLGSGNLHILEERCSFAAVFALLVEHYNKIILTKYTS